MCVPVLKNTTRKWANEALQWNPDASPVRVRLFTSGSTGNPEPQDKTLGHLVEGARALGARIEETLPIGLNSLSRIVCSVPQQHMFGLETSVMLSLVHGIPVREGRPLLPEDVRALLGEQHDAAWFTTPLHLRAMVRAGAALQGCRIAVSSTMTLDTVLAAQSESLLGCPVLEVYGSSETGALATRRTALTRQWTPLQGVRLYPKDGQTLAEGSHFASPVTLGDRIAINAQGGFELLGRRDDIVKIAGRRTSFSALNVLLQSMPDLEDGVFFKSEGRDGEARLALIHSGPLSRTNAIAWLRDRIDPAFVPRTVIRVEKLPRNEVGKVPKAALESIYAEWSKSRGKS